MKEQIKDIILKEDIKQPYTDKELSEKLLVSREYITSLRNELKIFDSRERRKQYICKEIVEILKSNENISYRELTRIINKKGYNVSRYLITKYMNEIIKNNDEISKNLPSTKDSIGNKIDEKAEDMKGAFNKLIGYRGSLEMQIKQVKAAVLYPPNGLHCLILGETGVGKSELAEAMYKFAIESKRLSKDSPFIVFNCADYAENSQLLISHLFGNVKGAYTGAVNDKKGLVEQANGGILFLDEVHRLAPEGQEILFQLIDKGRFRRLGETEASRGANVLLIAATTENVESTLLATFRRRIPMVIQIPSLKERPLKERLQLIKIFFGYESTRMNAPIHVTLDVIRAFLLYECFGNIGQLKSDIQVACAKSFLPYVMGKEEVVNINISDLNTHVKKGLIKINTKRNEIDKIVWEDFYFSPDQYRNPIKADESIYGFSKELYSYIEKAYIGYRKQGLDIDEINSRIGNEIERRLKNVIKHVKNSLMPLSPEEISNIVGDEITFLVKQILKIAEKRLGKMDSTIFYCLAIHLNTTFNRIKQGGEIINTNLEKIKRDYKEEYNVALEIVAYIKNYYGLNLPEDEIGFIALYLRGNKIEEEKEKKVGVVVITHGNVSIGMLEIANKLLNTNHGKAVVMTLEENPHEVLKKVTSVVKAVDEGKGVLMLVDMGSLLTFGEIIYQRTDIKIETIDRVDTVMVIEAIRRSILPGSNLKDVVYAIENLNYSFNKIRVKNRLLRKEKAIIVICLTGEGIALHCRRQLRKSFGKKLKDVELIHMGFIGRRDFYKKMQETMEKYEIVAIIGSINPKYPGIPFISLEELYSNYGEKQILSLLENGNKCNFIKSFKGLVPNIVKESKIIVNSNEKTKEELLKSICNILAEEGYVKKGYYEAVIEREKMTSYVINQEVALPHADSRYINKSVIVIVKLKNPILWDKEQKVSLICLLAVDTNEKDAIRYLYNKFKNKRVVNLLKKAKEAEEIEEALINE